MGRALQLCVAAAALLSCWQLTVSATQSNSTGFIRVSGTRFVDGNCNEWLFSGWNGWHLLEAATNKMTFPGYPTGKEYIVDMFRRATEHQLNLLRLFIIGDDWNGGRIKLKENLGQFNEEAFQGLDFILDEASKAGVKIIMVPSNLWKTNNGVPEFEKWCGVSSNNTRPGLDPGVQLQGDERIQTPYNFYMSTRCRQIYKEYLAAVVNRRNSINGLLYRDDPTIFAWNLMNEPRCKNCGWQPIDSWFKDMAQFLKSIDSNHLVTTGEDGFFDDSDPLEIFNPRGEWADHTGQDFVRNHDSPYIDFTVMHMWPDNWADYALSFGRNWIGAHMQASQALGKPLVLEEYGKNSLEQEIASVRDPWFRLAHEMVEESLDSGGPLRGVLFWEWDSDGTGPRDGSASTVRDGDSTIKNEIVPFSERIAARTERMHRTASGLVPGCTPVPLGSTTQAPPGNVAAAVSQPPSTPAQPTSAPAQPSSTPAQPQPASGAAVQSEPTAVQPEGTAPGEVPASAAQEPKDLALEEPECVDVAPPGTYTCVEQKRFGKCQAEYILRSDYCAKTCGRCSPREPEVQSFSGASKMRGRKLRA